MTTQTKTERAQKSIRGYPLTRAIYGYLNDQTLRTCVVLGIINIGHKRSLAPNLFSWIDQKLNEEIDIALEKMQKQKKP